MEVVQYLKEHGVAKLVSEFSIKVKEYEEGLLVLNYDQIESPKAHPIVIECRSLILDKEFNVVSRSFDRFFNLGEQPQTQEHIDWNSAVCYDKVDGSLIKIYHCNGKWEIATRGTAFAESASNGFDITFRQLVLKALDLSEDDFQKAFSENFDDCVTYIAEITSLENRVVRRYDGYKLHYLAARNNNTYEYEDWSEECASVGMQRIGQYKFSTVEDCVAMAGQLKDLDEGYVLYQDGKPVCKIKSPAYVAVHHLRGEGLNPKRISQLVLTGEEEEYLKYFPEDRDHIEPYVDALAKVKTQMVQVYERHKDIESQKDFALAVKEYPFSAVLFQARKNADKSVEAVFNEQTETHKIRMLEIAMEKPE